MNELMGYERQYVIEALRRDMHAELERVNTDPQWAEDHAHNARQDQRILEALNPKRAHWQ